MLGAFKEKQQNLFSLQQEKLRKFYDFISNTSLFDNRSPLASLNFFFFTLKKDSLSWKELLTKKEFIFNSLSPTDYKSLKTLSEKVLPQYGINSSIKEINGTIVFEVSLNCDKSTKESLNHLIEEGKTPFNSLQKPTTESAFRQDNTKVVVIPKKTEISRQDRQDQTKKEETKQNPFVQSSSNNYKNPFTPVSTDVSKSFYVDQDGNVVEVVGGGVSGDQVVNSISNIFFSPDSWNEVLSGNGKGSDYLNISLDILSLFGIGLIAKSLKAGTKTIKFLLTHGDEVAKFFKTASKSEKFIFATNINRIAAAMEKSGKNIQDVIKFFSKEKKVKLKVVQNLVKKEKLKKIKVNGETFLINSKNNKIWGYILKEGEREVAYKLSTPYLQMTFSSTFNTFFLYLVTSEVADTFTFALNKDKFLDELLSRSLDSQTINSLKLEGKYEPLKEIMLSKNDYLTKSLQIKKLLSNKAEKILPYINNYLITENLEKEREEIVRNNIRLLGIMFSTFYLFGLTAEKIENLLFNTIFKNLQEGMSKKQVLELTIKEINKLTGKNLTESDEFVKFYLGPLVEAFHNLKNVTPKLFSYVVHVSSNLGAYFSLSKLDEQILEQSESKKYNIEAVNAKTEKEISNIILTSENIRYKVFLNTQNNEFKDPNEQKVYEKNKNYFDERFYYYKPALEKSGLISTNENGETIYSLYLIDASKIKNYKSSLELWQNLFKEADERKILYPSKNYEDILVELIKERLFYSNQKSFAVQETKAKDITGEKRSLDELLSLNEGQVVTKNGVYINMAAFLPELNFENLISGAAVIPLWLGFSFLYKRGSSIYIFFKSKDQKNIAKIFDDVLIKGMGKEQYASIKGEILQSINPQLENAFKEAKQNFLNDLKNQQNNSFLDIYNKHFGKFEKYFDSELKQFKEDILKLERLKDSSVDKIGVISAKLGNLKFSDFTLKADARIGELLLDFNIPINSVKIKSQHILNYYSKNISEEIKNIYKSKNHPAKPEVVKSKLDKTASYTYRHPNSAAFFTAIGLIIGWNTLVKPAYNFIKKGSTPTIEVKKSVEETPLNQQDRLRNSIIEQIKIQTFSTPSQLLQKVYEEEQTNNFTLSKKDLGEILSSYFNKPSNFFFDDTYIISKKELNEKTFSLFLHPSVPCGIKLEGGNFEIRFDNGEIYYGVGTENNKQTKIGTYNKNAQSLLVNISFKLEGSKLIVDISSNPDLNLNYTKEFELSTDDQKNLENGGFFISWFLIK